MCNNIPILINGPFSSSLLTTAVMECSTLFIYHPPSSGHPSQPRPRCFLKKTRSNALHFVNVARGTSYINQCHPPLPAAPSFFLPSSFLHFTSLSFLLFCSRAAWLSSSLYVPLYYRLAISDAFLLGVRQLAISSITTFSV